MTDSLVFRVYTKELNQEQLETLHTLMTKDRIDKIVNEALKNYLDLPTIKALNYNNSEQPY